MSERAESKDMVQTVVEVAPAVWVGCLACYNDSRLVGEWVAAKDAEKLVPCRRPGHDEWWCFDQEGLRGFVDGECSPMEASTVGRTLEEIDRAGIPADVVLKWLLERHYAPEQASEHLDEIATELTARC